MDRVFWSLVLFASLRLFAGCGSAASTPVVPVAAVDVNVVRAANIHNKHIVDSAVSLLRSGYVVLRRGLGADSYMLSEMNRRNKTYSHCGIVMVENGYPFVYHSIGGEDNPDERLRRDSANFFFSPKNNTHLAIVQYEFDSADVYRLQAVVTRYYKDRPKFDMKFDLATDDKLYCSEFVYKAINRTMDDTAYVGTSVLLKRRQVGIDDLYLNPHANMIWEVKFK